MRRIRQPHAPARRCGQLSRWLSSRRPVLTQGLTNNFTNQIFLLIPYTGLRYSDMAKLTHAARTAHIDLADWLIEFWEDNK